MPEDPENTEGQEDLNVPPPFFPYVGNLPERDPDSRGDLIEVEVEGVLGSGDGGNLTRFVLLADGERKLPIVIGPFEAAAILQYTENAQPERPMTHDLIRNVLEGLDASIDRVVIDDLWNSTYYARLYVRTKEGDEIEFDSRPSDAIALAIRWGAPILVADKILEAAAE